MEVREYEPYVIAQATVSGPMRKSMSGGFMKVARFAAPPPLHLPSAPPNRARLPVMIPAILTGNSGQIQNTGIELEWTPEFG